MIQMYHVFKSFAAHAPALEDITFRVEAGEFAVLTGPSGAGKTTLLRLLYAAERPDRGNIIVNRRNVTRLARRRIPGISAFHWYRLSGFQAYFPQKLPLKMSPSRNGSWPFPNARSVGGSQTCLKRVGISHRKDALPPQLSGGEQQRVALARALVNEPALILADEPTGNLDDALAQDIHGLAYEVNVDGTTVLIATHDRNWSPRPQDVSSPSNMVACSLPNQGLC